MGKDQPLKEFRGKVTKTYTFDVVVKAKSHEHADSCITDLDEHDFDESPYPPGSAELIPFEDGSIVEITLQDKAEMDFSAMQGPCLKEASNA